MMIILKIQIKIHKTHRFLTIDNKPYKVLKLSIILNLVNHNYSVPVGL